jgi:hypothetical protein
MLPVNSVRLHSFTMFAEISASRMMVVSCWQGLIPVQFLAMAVSTEKWSAIVQLRPMPEILYLGSQHWVVTQPLPGQQE